MLAPIALIAFWGGSYVVDCIQLLSNPGVPVEFAYKSPGGEVRLRAESYSVNLENGDIRVLRPKVFNPQGVLIAFAERISVEGAPILSTQRRAIVRVDDPFVTITRLSDGRLDILDFLPERDETPSEFPFSVLIDRGTVKLVDTTTGKRFDQFVRGRDIRVDGAGDNWLGSAAVTLDGIGSLTGTVQSFAQQGLLVRGETPGLELGQLYDFFRTTPEGRRLEFLKEFDVDELIVRGPLSVFLPRDRDLELTATLYAEGTNIRYARKYSADRAVFEGSITETGARGVAVASAPNLDAEFEGSIEWEDQPSFGGSLVARTRNAAALPDWIAEFVPQELDVNGAASFAGFVAYEDREGLAAEGEIEAARASILDEPITSPKVLVAYEPGGLRMRVLEANWRGAPITGSVALNPDTGELDGALFARTINLGGLAKRFGLRGLTGNAQVSAIVGGTIEDPIAEFRAEGKGSVARPGRRAVTLSNMVVTASMRDGRVTLGQAYAETGLGNLVAQGAYNLDRDNLNIKLEVSGVALGRIDPRLEGIARFQGNLTGKLADPRYHGAVELFGLQIAEQTIPVATANISGSLDRLEATNINAIKGAGNATGRLALNLRNNRIDGLFAANGLQISDLVGEQFIGVVNVPELRIGGTLDNLQASGIATSDAVLLESFRADNVSTRFGFANNIATFRQLNANAFGGSVSGSGRFNLDTKQGTAEVAAEGLVLERLLPPNQLDVDVEGTLSASGTLTFSTTELLSADATGNLRDVRINNTYFGGGNLNVSSVDDRITGSLQLANLDRFILLEDVSYDRSEKAVEGTVVLHQVPLQELYTTARPYVPSLDERLRQFLDTTGANLNAEIVLSGPSADPNLDVRLLEASNVTLGGRPGGDLRTVFSKVGDLWTIDELNWSGEPFILTMNGQGMIDEDGLISLDLDLNNLNLNYLSLIDPSLSNLQGRANIPVTVSGNTASPTIEGSFTSTRYFAIGQGEDVPQDRRFRVNLDRFSITETIRREDGTYTGGVQTFGSFAYMGFTGRVTASVPFQYPFTLPENAPMNIVVDLGENPRTLSADDLPELANLLDMERTKGEYGGRVEILGSPQNPVLRGAMALRADTLAFNGQDFALEGLIADVQLERQTITLIVNTSSSLGGAARANYAVRLPDLNSLFRSFATGQPTDFLQTPGTGNLVVEDLVVNQEIGTGGRVRGSMEANIDIGGTLASPSLSGRIAAREAVVAMPSALPAGTGERTFPINPRFNITLDIEEQMTFQTATASLDLDGAGTLTGSLAEPNLNAEMYVERGSIRLPASRVNIEPGGIVRPRYQVVGGAPVASIDVDLEGTTRVTAAGFGNNVETYNINLGVRGDLLEEGGLLLTATSDPPGLSQERILAMLGQLDLIEGLGGAGTEARIRDALAGFAIPSLLDPFTSGIARSLGLEYLALEYNAFQGTSIAFAKSLGGGFTIQGRRQLTDPGPGLDPEYDLRLTYRLPFRQRNLSRLYISLGIDQDRPWKAAIEYGFRF